MEQNRRRPHWTPHGCGEDRMKHGTTSIAQETPPRTWGSAAVEFRLMRTHGNIPTDVGKRRRLRHPREPLGNTPTDVGKAQRSGSALIVVCVGNTPTDVGKARRSFSWSGFRRKHPHECGEGTMPFEFGQFNEETPPRMWGSVYVPRPVIGTVGNTPTVVGKPRD